LALFETALGEGVQVIEHALRKIARHRGEYNVANSSYVPGSIAREVGL
jgi:hypothetical protein